MAVLIGQFAGPSPSPPASTTASNLATGRATEKPTAVKSLTQCLVHMGGLTLGDHLSVPESALERWDCDAPANGPWSVVIRAAGGSFGLKGAVVTFPVEDKVYGVAVTEPRGGRWVPTAQTLVWPLAGSHAQIVGDLGQAQLAVLAARVTVANHRPHVASLDGFAGVANYLSYNSPVVHEMRYGAKDLGQASAFGDGVVATGVTWAASFESLAFESHAQPAGLVRGNPALYSTALGGSGTLAWESAPGEVTYILYSGPVSSSAAAIEALRSLADKGQVLTPEQWQTTDRESVNASTN